MVGVILVVGLLITPAATAYLLSDRLERMMVLSAIFGVTSVIGGLYLCVWLDSSGGGAIMLFCTLQFLVVLLVAPKYGIFARWLRVRNIIPQQVIEDVLTTILRHQETTPLTILRQYVENGKWLGKALKQTIHQNLVVGSGQGFQLTDQGEKEAKKVLRAHRLWETYLDTIGTPLDQLHATAHHLEHIREEGTVEYLDERLGKPEKDPHGQAIPDEKKE